MTRFFCFVVVAVRIQAPEFLLHTILRRGYQPSNMSSAVSAMGDAGAFVALNHSWGIEVEQPVTRLPPHRPRRAELPHRVPQDYSLGCYTLKRPFSVVSANSFPLFVVSLSESISEVRKILPMYNSSAGFSDSSG